jgi:hypothetical protein
MIPTALKTQLNDGFAQVKMVGHDRFNKIRGILSEFGPQVGAELVAGAKEVGGIGRAIGEVALQVLQTQARTWRAAIVQRVQTLWADRFPRPQEKVEQVPPSEGQSAIEVPYQIMEDQAA